MPRGVHHGYFTVTYLYAYLKETLFFYMKVAYVLFQTVFYLYVKFYLDPFSCFSREGNKYRMKAYYSLRKTANKLSLLHILKIDRLNI